MLGKIEGKKKKGMAEGEVVKMVSSTQRTGPGSGKQRRTTEPGALCSMGLQRVGHNLATEQQQQSNKSCPWHPCQDVCCMLSKQNTILPDHLGFFIHVWLTRNSLQFCKGQKVHLCF
uniref:Uncharacterized protein n=1 Tax=Micrurus lemniscatus lemniscatus TaxID=129467 RepID=A0A2D4HWB6_MICLE